MSKVCLDNPLLREGNYFRLPHATLSLLDSAGCLAFCRWATMISSSIADLYLPSFPHSRWQIITILRSTLSVIGMTKDDNMQRAIYRKRQSCSSWNTEIRTGPIVSVHNKREENFYYINHWALPTGTAHWRWVTRGIYCQHCATGTAHLDLPITYE